MDSQYTDFHTHRPSREGECVIQDGTDTWGIHPWNADAMFVVPTSADGLLAIGECGLDAHAQASPERQLAVLKEHIMLADKWRLPLIIHCVKRLDTLLALHKTLHTGTPWILHGFRGKPQQMQSLLNAGFYISFGFKHNSESLALCPIDRLLLETDDDPRPIRLLYEEAARLRCTTPEKLRNDMRDQYKKLFAKT